MGTRRGSDAINVRIPEPEMRRLEQHVSEPPFDGDKSRFTRWALGIVMDMREAQGPSFDLVVAGLRKRRDDDLPEAA